MGSSHATSFRADGWCLVPELYSPDEVASMRDHFMTVRKKPQPGDDAPIDPHHVDPLRRYPRLMHPHRFDEVARGFLTDSRIAAVFDEILDEWPLGVQTMLYFKPPGARGQALHQDQYYLHAEPGTCVAAWLALDDCDDENGAMLIVPGSHDLPVLCTMPADASTSFTDVTVPIPEGSEPELVEMRAGDVLFFNGSVIHGSGPNRSNTRFRRALIGHYATADVRQIGRFYAEAYTFDGRIVTLDENGPGATCGEFVPGGAVVQRPVTTSTNPSEAH
ncbi:MAG: phytanoyl-CoA dioxygenase family protein [Fimbriimonadaceae bacterium]|nr:phytanoyl-CoA dioxygenase family protein [Fimbriimonadaceae bacterium]